jgi:hypothetical protein
MRWSWRRRPTHEAAGRSDELDRVVLQQGAGQKPTVDSTV